MAGAANLAAAVASGADVTTVERLLAGNADISAVAGERRETALHFAARREPTLTSILLSAGASLDSTCTEGFTPLHAVSLVTALPSPLFLKWADTCFPRRVTSRAARGAL